MKTKKIFVLAILALLLLGLMLSVAVADEIKPIGACCLPNGGCWETTPLSCDGEFLGPGTTCDQCPGAVGGVTEPLQASVLMLPAIAVGTLVVLSVATTLLVKRRRA
jgi:hypothetical protein